MSKRNKTEEQPILIKRVYDIKDIIREKEELEAKNRRAKFIKISTTLVISVVLIVCVIMYSLFYVRKDYNVNWSISRSATSNYQYEKFGDGFVEAGMNVANYYSLNNKLIWSTYLEYSSPKLVVNGDKGVIYDSMRNGLVPFDKDKLYTQIKVDGKILSTQISDKEKIIILSQKNDDFTLGVYSFEGELLLDTKSTLMTNGAPVDFGFSEDESFFAVAYIKVSDKESVANTVVYNLSENDENKRIIGSLLEVDNIVGQLKWISDNEFMEIGANNVYKFSVKNNELTSKKLPLDKNIMKATIRDKEVVAVSKEKNNINFLSISSSLNKKLHKSINQVYNDVELSEDRVFITSDKKIKTYTLTGREDLHLTFDENVRHILKYNSSEYIVILDNKILQISVEFF